MIGENLLTEKNKKRLKEIAEEVLAITKEEGMESIWLTTRVNFLGGASCMVTADKDGKFQDIWKFEDLGEWSDVLFAVEQTD